MAGHPDCHPITTVFACLCDYVQINSESPIDHLEARSVTASNFWTEIVALIFMSRLLPAGSANMGSPPFIRGNDVRRATGSVGKAFSVTRDTAGLWLRHWRREHV